MKSIAWLGDSLDIVRAFPDEARTQIGQQLRRVQQGLEPTDWKPMPGIGLGANEIRVHVDTAHRVVYVAKFAEAVYVLHAITKKTRKTPQRDIDLAAKRFREIVNERRAK